MEIVLHRLSKVLVPNENDEADSVMRSRLMCHGDRARAQEILIEAQNYYNAMYRFRKDRERNKRYNYGDQWGDVVCVNGKKMTEEQYILSQGNIPLKTNLIRRLVRNVIGVYRSQSTEPTCTARDRDEQRFGETMSTVLQYNMQLNRMQEVNARSMEEFLISGLVCYRKWYGWRNDRLDCWTDYVQPNNFFIDNNMRDFRGWDVSLVGEVHDVSFETLCRQFAQSPSDFSRLRQIYSRSHSLDAISRKNQRRCLTVTAEVADGYNVTLITNQATKAMETLDLGEGVSYAFAGENETIMEAVEQLLLMLLLGVLLVYLVMVAQFQSLKSPFIVMFTIPLAFTGGFLALLLCGMEISVISLVGFVMLTGIIVNNGIVLVDYINQLRADGMERRAAILEAGKTRMRPILMTSVTTILGLADMALSRSAGSAIMQPIAIVCIGGLIYATLMTLLVVPCIYDIVNKKELRVVRDEDMQLQENM